MSTTPYASVPRTFITILNAGFIGANFAELMVKKYEGKYNIVVFDKLTYAGNLHNLDGIKDKITFVQGDICDFDFVMETYK